MSDPLRLKFQSIRDLPPTVEILRRVTRDRHVVLEFSPSLADTTMNLVLQKLKRESPEHYSIYDAGGGGSTSWVTIMEVVSRAAVLAMEEDLIHSAHHFRHTATELALALADRAGVSPERLWNSPSAFATELQGWDIFRHGEHCCFKHQTTGQTVEVSLWYGLEFGALDPWFFYHYMSTTPELHIPVKIRDDFHDMSRALSILEERGRLIRVQGVISGIEGLVAAPLSNHWS